VSQANLDVVRRGWDAWLRRDLPGFFDIFDPEVVWDTSHFHDWPEAAYHRIEGLERFLGEWLAVWADLEVEIDDVIAAPDGRVVTLFRQRGKGRDSGIPMEMSQAHIATLRNGKVTRVDNYEDRGEALRDAGLAS
jgi:ketosteroid isomerase-like protein